MKKINEQVLELTNILYGYRHFNSSMKKCMEKLGYRITKLGTHVKCYTVFLVTTIASTPSDLNDGH